MYNLKIITDKYAVDLEKQVNEFLNAHEGRIISTTYQMGNEVYAAFIEYEMDWETKLKKDLEERRKRVNKATQYYENSDKMTMEEVLHDAG